MTILFHKGPDEPIIEWTTVHFLTFSEECEKRYLEMSEEELEQKLDLKNNPGIRKTIEECRKKYNACKRWIFEKSDKLRRKATETYPELEGCPPDCRNPDCFQEFVVDTRGNMSPRMSKNVPFWLMSTIVLCSKW